MSKKIKQFSETTIALMFVGVLFCSLIYVFCQISKVKAERLSCPKFKTQTLAQQYFDSEKQLEKMHLPYDHQYTRLDGDGNGKACESNPR